ncbi:hypothetical protein [Ponticaulis sp.]|uniref:hypothetical protein n=1 Tax=Ponticaulis sp. TaxID=2020902 RepID=UPI000E7F72B1|nr:hypothetical protein [Ponticaulis sp.]HBH88655.1 hypothetical protein [Hyphomonadaceae bacterium]
MRSLILAVSAALVAGCASAEAPTLESAESFMWAYTEAWNAHDTEALGRDFWQMTGSVEEETSRLEMVFTQLEADGYDRSIIHEVLVCDVEGETARAGMRFTRYLTSGEVMGDDMRASGYELTWADEKGWRITGMFAAVADEPLSCEAL